jgi:REP element-mobilizing transposase RayT
MSHSFTNLLYHIIFSTKERRPWLEAELRPGLFACLGSLIKEERGLPLLINGVADHVHILAKLKQDRAVADVVRAIKAHSSAWMHRQDANLAPFAWQTGYGAFTVSYSQVEVVRAYIRNQEQHHRRQTFQQEFRAFLRRHGIEFTEEELWD